MPVTPTATELSHKIILFLWIYVKENRETIWFLGMGLYMYIRNTFSVVTPRQGRTRTNDTLI